MKACEMSGPVKITQLSAGPRDLVRVLDLYRTAKRTLGFLPDAGFKDRAAAGTLLGASVGDELRGYLLYDLPGDHIKIRHLCVAPSERKSGVARLLVEALVARHPDRRGVSLACRRSYKLDGMWSTLGFRAINERVGNSLNQELLTIWERDFGHPTLFTLAEPAGDFACLDQVVFEDLVVDRPEGLHSKHLLDDWVAELITLCVTDEVSHESNKTEHTALRVKLLRAIPAFRRLHCPDSEWKQHERRVKELVAKAGPGDQRHLCRAVGSGATYFLTRDDDVLEGAARIASEFGLAVLRPEDLLDRLDRQRRQDRYEPAALQGTALIDEPLPAEQADEFVHALINSGSGEKAYMLRRLVSQGLADPHGEVRVIRHPDHGIIAGVTRRVVDNKLHVTALRVRRVSRLTDTVARQLVFQQRRETANHALTGVIVADKHPQAAVLRAMDAEDLLAKPDGTREGNVERGIIDIASLDLVSPDPDQAAAYERRNWPVKIKGAGLVTWMVSIKPAYAEQLFDTELAEGTLFARQQELGLSRELIYYKSPGNLKNLKPPTRILWYVSQQPPGHPVGHIRAVSQLAEVVVGRPRTLHSRFARLGVWSQRQVEHAGRRTGQVMALRFTDTEVFENPLSEPDLKNLYAKNGKQFRAPFGPIRVGEHMFCLMYERASRYA